MIIPIRLAVSGEAKDGAEGLRYIGRSRQRSQDQQKHGQPQGLLRCIGRVLGENVLLRPLLLLCEHSVNSRLVLIVTWAAYLPYSMHVLYISIEHFHGCLF